MDAQLNLSDSNGVKTVDDFEMFCAAYPAFRMALGFGMLFCTVGGIVLFASRVVVNYDALAPLELGLTIIGGLGSVMGVALSFSAIVMLPDILKNGFKLVLTKTEISQYFLTGNFSMSYWGPNVTITIATRSLNVRKPGFGFLYAFGSVGRVIYEAVTPVEQAEVLQVVILSERINVEWPIDDAAAKNLLLWLANNNIAVKVA